MAHQGSTRPRRLRLALALALSFTLVAAACGGDDDDDTAADDTETEDTTSEDTADDTSSEDTEGGDEEAAADGDAPKMAIVYSAEWFDGSWGEMAYDGANQLLDEGVISDLALEENVPPGADAERALRAYAEDGFNPIIAHSFNYGDDVKAVAADFPDTIFVYAGGFGDVEGNVGDYDQPFYQASYLSGILAAGVMGEGAVGGAGGFEIPACYSMYEAYLAGVQEIMPDATGSFVAVGDWYDVQLAKEAALGQADQGATMFIGCGQGPTFGQIEAANDTGGVSTGYVGDMAEVGDSVLSSFIWNLDKTFALMVEDVVAGSTEAQYYSVPLAEDGMEVVISPNWSSEIPEDTMALFEERLAEIQAGEFEVPFVPEAG
ncbi:MAG: BMP family protein [Actinomycetota bacterium]|nr:BMP family protein [Actinomycetota bacterium]